MKQVILKTIVIFFLIFIIGIVLLYVPQKVEVLGYHSFYIEKTDNINAYTMDIKKFDQQMKYLSDNSYKSLSLDEYYDWKVKNKKIPRKSILITFDDGYITNYKYAFDILKKYDLKGVVFIIGSYVSGSDGNEETNAYFSLEQMNETIKNYPNIEFASHTFNMHDYDLSNKTCDLITEDINKFNEVIKTEYHAYPFGLSNELVERCYQENNYKLAFGFGPGFTDFRKSSKKDNNYHIPRINIDGEMSMIEYVIRLKSPF